MIVLLLGSCMSRDAAPEMSKQEAMPSSPAPIEQDGEGAMGGGRARREEGRVGKKDAPSAPRGAAFATSADMEDASLAPPEDAPSGEPTDGPQTRAWFPESFLWMPLVETSSAGVASVPVPVPDTLTTWRVLALGQSGEGAQGGTVASFASTLPAYVDVVTPSFLMADDELALPIQVVSQQAGGVRETLSVSTGSTSWQGAVAVDGFGSWARSVPISAGAPGLLGIRAALGSLDAVEKSIPVRPSGRPIDQVRGGTLAGPRDIVLDGIPGGRFGGVTVTVFPGVRSIVATEVGVAGHRNGVHAAAYAWSLAGRAGPLSGQGDITEDSLRELSLLAQQRLTRAMRSPTPVDAAAALAGLRGADPDTLAGRLAARLEDSVTRGQQPDGLWGMESGAALDAVLVQTAQAVWALGPDAKASRLRATAAFERHRDRLSEPTVAAWALAAGVVETGLVDEARKVVSEAVKRAPDGSRRLAGTWLVGESEATAVAALALTEESVRADLAAGLLARYSPWQGFGHGYANLVALEALSSVMGGEIPTSARISLTVDGVAVGEGALDPAVPWRPITLTAPALVDVGEHRITLTSEPAVPGLAFVLTSRSYLPWEQQEPDGLDVVVTPGAMEVGVPSFVTVTVAGPPGRSVDVDVGLPAGFDLDRAQMPAGPAWQAEDGEVRFTGIVLDGGSWTTALPVTPTVLGRLQTGPTTVRSDGAEFTRIPTRWTVR